MSWPGGHVRYHDQTVKFLQRLDLNITWNVRVEKMLSWLTDKEQPVNCLFSYWEEPDTHAHEYGPNHPLVLQQVTKVDKMVANLVDKLKAAGLLSRTNFVFLSDHGFAEVRLVIPTWFFHCIIILQKFFGDIFGPNSRS